MPAIRSPRNKLTKIITAKLFRVGLSRNVPSAADAVIKIGEEVPMYRENPIRMWIRPYLVTHFDGRVLRLDTGDLIIGAFVYKVKRHYMCFADSGNDSGDNESSDERAENITSRLLSILTPPSSADIIDTKEIVAKSVDQDIDPD